MRTIRLAGAALLPWMATATAFGTVDVPVPVRLAMFGLPENLSPPAVRLGDECFLPLEHARKAGWKVELSGEKATVTVGGTRVAAFCRKISQQNCLPVRSIAETAGGLTEWTGDTSLVVCSRIKRIEVENASILVEGTLPVRAQFLLLESPRRLVLDVSPAKLDRAKPPTTSGSFRYSQFDSSTVRVVAELDDEPSLVKPVTGERTAKVFWRGAKSVKVSKIDFASQPPPEPFKIGGLLLTVDTPELAIVQIPVSGAANWRFSAKRDGNGVYWIDFPSAESLEDSNPREIVGSAVRSARVLPRQGGGYTLRVETAGPMGVRVGVVGPNLEVRFTKPRGAGGTLAGKTIVLDAGHGGRDAGAVGRFGEQEIREKDLTLAITKRIASILEAEGTTVVMTREEDTYVELYSRPELANSCNADLFISIHINSNTVVNSKSGTFTYFHMDVPDSRLLADCIQAEIARVSGLPDNGSRSDRTLYDTGLAVLRASVMPAVLVEIAYINHEGDVRRLLDEAFQQAVAEAVVKGLREYIGG